MIILVLGEYLPWERGFKKVPQRCSQKYAHSQLLSWGRTWKGGVSKNYEQIPEVPTVLLELSSYQLLYLVFRFRQTLRIPRSSSVGFYFCILPECFSLFNRGFSTSYRGQKGTSSKAWPLNTAIGTFLLSKYDNWTIRLRFNMFSRVGCKYLGTSVQRV